MNTWLMTYPEDKTSLPFYLRFASTFGPGATPVSADNDWRSADPRGFAGLLLSGGGDVDPSRYGDDTKHEKTYGVRPERDEMEIELIIRFMEAGKPIVGICRGLQILAVHFGGRLIQHIPDTIEQTTECHRVPKGYDCIHPLHVDAATGLGAALRGVRETNSAHHQAIHPGFPMRHLRIAARSNAGIIEAVESFDHPAPIIAVQWHPERLPDDHPARTRLAGFIREATGQTRTDAEPDTHIP